MGDVLAFRMRQRPVRAAAATSTLAVSFFYLLAQMAGAGGLVALLLDITSKAGQALVIAVVGAVMIVYVLVGGMKGTTWVQIIKAVLLIAGAAVMTIWVLGQVRLQLLRAARRRRRDGRRRRARSCSSRARSTARARITRSTSSRWRSRWCSAPRACRTS